MAAGGVLAALMLGLGLAATVCLSSGCASLGYYTQVAGGHLDLMSRARPVAEALADPATPAAQRERLLLSQRLRSFAVAELKLPDNSSYQRFADLGREAAVWNVIAAPELSLALKTWCFPVMGCVGYRGYFDRALADAMAAQLRAEDLESSVYGVPAYSTLGWSNWLGGDPLLSTFITWPEAELARLIFHEMTHQVAYAADDTTFNESFAVAVERIGGRRWLAQQGKDALRAAAQTQERRREEFRAFAQRWRGELDSIYTSTLADDYKRARKAEVMALMRADYQSLKAERWAGWSGYDAWVAGANNAAFGILAAYHELVPQFEALFQRCGGDFERFYAQVRRQAALPRTERRAALAAAEGVCP